MIAQVGPSPCSPGGGSFRPFKRLVFASQSDEWHICKGIKCLMRTLRGTPVLRVLLAMQQLRIETVSKAPLTRAAHAAPASKLQSRCSQPLLPSHLPFAPFSDVGETAGAFHRKRSRHSQRSAGWLMTELNLAIYNYIELG